MECDENGLEVLDRTECVRLLETRSLGRIAISVDALPTILPVNYAMVGDDQVVIRTRRGTRLSTATRNAVVAFEVDEFDDTSGDGWSVLVRGVAREVQPDTAPPPGTTVWPWQDASDTRLVGISLDLVSGRRLGLRAAAQPSRQRTSRG